MGDEPELGSESDSNIPQGQPFEQAMRALDAFEFQPDCFTMRPLVCALHDVANSQHPESRVPLGTVMRSANRRAVTRQAGAG